MNKCGKVKNPCKLCLRGVTTKTGVQCKGVCKKWAHFKCLNYTPGKIQDIKAGIIKITCPCPDCNTTEPKEIMVDPPYTCNNFQCPANSLPTCESTDCPSMYHITKTPIMPEPSPSNISSHIRPPLCPIKQRCDNSPPSSPPMNWSFDSSSFPKPLDGPTCKKQCEAQPISKVFEFTPNSKPCPPPPRCPPSNRPCPHLTPMSQVSTRTESKMCSPIRSLSCSYLARDSTCTGSQRTWSQNDKSLECDTTITPKYISSSDSQLSKSRETQKSLYCTIEQMCSTVGQLSGQLKELMCRMMEAFEKNRPC
ncbi:unnamed protein product [Parnassius mnemosyne]|uniref:Uncharacterized protein n=1 Tax=Parnassius mnemosyne TaxID=213953 RepID=A0AAV1LK47_9NEOP